MKRKTEIDSLFQIAVKRAMTMGGMNDYRPGDPLDPGTIIIRTLLAGMLQLRDKAAASAAQRALDMLRWHLAGPPRGARPERALVEIMGPTGTHVPRDSRIKWRGENGYAETTRSLHLAEPAGAVSVLADGSTVDLAAQIWEGRVIDKTPSPYQPLRAIQFGVQQPMICRRFPGLYFEGLPTALALRVQEIVALTPQGRQPLHWFFHPAARVRIHVPPQDVPGWRDGIGWIEIALHVEPGESRHIGRARLNVVVARSPINARRHPLMSDGLIGFTGIATGKLGCEQVGPSWGAGAIGRTTISAWLRGLNEIHSARNMNGFAETCEDVLRRGERALAALDTLARSAGFGLTNARRLPDLLFRDERLYHRKSSSIAGQPIETLPGRYGIELGDIVGPVALAFLWDNADHAPLVLGDVRVVDVDGEPLSLLGPLDGVEYHFVPERPLPARLRLEAPAHLTLLDLAAYSDRR